MKINNIADLLASEMEKNLNSDENKGLFSSASLIEKLAFRKVSDEDQPSEIELELEASLNKSAGCHGCSCDEKKDESCKCDCHNDANDAKDSKKSDEETSTQSKSSGLRDAFNALLKISETLDEYGFERLAAASAILADKLVIEAKAKSKKSKDSKKSDKKDDKKSKKEDMKARMDKMRAAKDKKDGKGKSDKKTSKTAQNLSSQPAVHPVAQPLMALRQALQNWTKANSSTALPNDLRGAVQTLEQADPSNPDLNALGVAARVVGASHLTGRDPAVNKAATELFQATRTNA
jgi:hypothetical protein